MAGLSRAYCRGHGFKIAHFAQQYDIGILPYDMLHGVGVAERVKAEFSLADNGFFVAVHELYGIFNSDNMGRAVAVNVINHSGERRGFAAAGRSRNQHKPSLVIGYLGYHGRQFQVAYTRDLRRYYAQCHIHETALAENIYPEAADSLKCIGEVNFAALLENFFLLGVHDAVRYRDGIARAYKHAPGAVN